MFITDSTLCNGEQACLSPTLGWKQTDARLATSGTRYS